MDTKAKGRAVALLIQKQSDPSITYDLISSKTGYSNDS
jgi:hypothetical protein